MTTYKTLTASILSAIVLTAAPALAASTTSKSVDVSLKGLDLADPVDARTVLERIRDAAKRSCSVTTHRQSITERQLAVACAEAAIDQAVDALDAPLVRAARQSER